MKRVRKIVFLVILVFAVVYAGYVSFQDSSVKMDNFIAVANGENGDSVVSWYKDGKTVLAQINSKGKIKKYISYDTINDKQMYTINGISCGADGMVYLLRNVENAYDGEVTDQQLIIYDFSGFRAKEKKSFSLSNDQENYTYRWMNVSGETITLIATDRDESTAIRRTYEYGSILSGTLNIKNTRTYPIDQEEGIYYAAANSTDLVYISDSGKIYHATEDEAKEIFPARTLDTLMYPTFLAYAESGYEYFGEHESGDIIKLDLSTGEEDVVQSGSSSFEGVSQFTAKDIVAMSMSSMTSYTAVVYNSQTENYNLLVTFDGTTKLIDSLTYSFGAGVLRFVTVFLVVFAAAIAAALIIWGFFAGMRKGRTIMGRLLCAAVPLIAIALGVFGVIAYSYYKEVIEDDFKKQTVDEGNMLTALFGQDSFNEIEYPYDYSGEAYQYLIQQLETRELYSRTLYYEEGELYIGVDREYPCFYPADIMLNESAKELYRQAALTGNAVTGYIEDQEGKRMVCITPVGGVSGQTVYLLETGVFVSNIDLYMQSYVKNFRILCVAFFLIILVLMSIEFYQVLLPIYEIRQAMQRFIDGDREARITLGSEDELSGISRIFNKMVEDSLLKDYNIKKLTTTYYRFVPQSMMEFLETDNLAELTLGSGKTGTFILLKVVLDMGKESDIGQYEERTNCFFAILNQFAMENQLIPVADQSDLRDFVLVSPQGIQNAMNFVLAVLAKADAENMGKKKKDRMKLLFVMHKAQARVSICGDESRYIPALFSPEVKTLMKQQEFLKKMGSRILVTQEAYDEFDTPQLYGNRYIGKMRTEEKEIPLYDVYSDKNAEHMRRIIKTQQIFDKAMHLYEEHYYYEAKNLFSLVLRENSEDMAAKYYIFQCEELQH